ncbi:MAG TPA: arsenate reductase (glutaredoxin) [Oceanospirillaceae bacterium]|nr:arsenate reductase (glutaredoxin) [Oceanospirillaceae bacterium]
MSVSIYHNPRCSKSRTALALLEEHGVIPEVRLYLEDGPSAAEISELLSMLGMSSPRELMRKGEDAYKEGNLSNDALSSDDLIAAMVATPKLIERPIVINNDKARIGRPPEQVLEIL